MPKKWLKCGFGNGIHNDSGAIDGIASLFSFITGGV